MSTAPKVAGGNLTREQVSGLQDHAEQLVRRYPGRTARELALVSPLCAEDPRVLNRRLSEVEKLGRVERGPRRKCKVTGRQAATWSPPRPAEKAKPVVNFFSVCMDCDRNTVRREGGPRLQVCPDCQGRLVVRCTTDSPDPREALAREASRQRRLAQPTTRCAVIAPVKEKHGGAATDLH